MVGPSLPPSGPVTGVSLPRPLVLRVLKMCLRAQWIVGGTCACVAIAYPQTEVYGCIAGAFANAFLGKLLKRAIAQDRPVFATQKKKAAAEAAAAAASKTVIGSALQEVASEVAAATVDAAVFAADTLGVEHPSPSPLFASLPHPMPSEKDLGHGMPSSHATSLFYFATYLTLAAYHCGWSHSSNAVLTATAIAPHPFTMLLRTYVPNWLQVSWTDGLARSIMVATLYTLVTLECRSRVRRHLHSWAQIIAGATLGSCVAIAHTMVLMPFIREQCRDVPPLKERSTQFQLLTVAGFAVVGLLTLERRAQRIARTLIKSAVRKIRGGGKPRD